MFIAKAKKGDLLSILQLQYLAYQSEAQLLNNFAIPPLQQTIEKLQEEWIKGFVLKATGENDEIIGSVRGFIENNTLFIGKLIVQPDRQGRGIGTKLLTHVETMYPQLRYELFTSNRSVNNIRLYEKMGYVRFKEQQISPELTFIYLEKKPEKI